jgi:hypothetical protein
MTIGRERSLLIERLKEGREGGMTLRGRKMRVKKLVETKERDMEMERERQEGDGKGREH